MYITIKIFIDKETHRENLDAVTAVTDPFRMADAFDGDPTGDAVAQTNAQTIDISVWQGRVWVNRLQGMHGSGWQVVLRAKSAIVDPRHAAVTVRGWCSISFVKQNEYPVTTEIPSQRQWNQHAFYGTSTRMCCIRIRVLIAVNHGWYSSSESHLKTKWRLRGPR